MKFRREKILLLLDVDLKKLYHITRIGLRREKFILNQGDDFWEQNGKNMKTLCPDGKKKCCIC